MIFPSPSFLDSSFNGADKAIFVNPIKEKMGSGSTGISLENAAFVDRGVAVRR